MRDVRTRGETPLHRAAAFGDEAMITQLLERGADRRLRDANGDTPLSWASWHLRPASILALLAYDGHTVTAGHVASYTGDHGKGWGGLEAHTLGEYLPLAR
jgi:ankyrin repeat protein